MAKFNVMRNLKMKKKTFPLLDVKKRTDFRKYLRNQIKLTVQAEQKNNNSSTTFILMSET